MPTDSIAAEQPGRYHWSDYRCYACCGCSEHESSL